MRAMESSAQPAAPREQELVEPGEGSWLQSYFSLWLHELQQQELVINGVLDFKNNEKPHYAVL